MSNEELKAILKSLEHKRGCIDANIIVDAAAEPEHPLHDYFEWDDAVAGARYRIDQAERLMRRVQIEVVYETREFDAAKYVSADKNMEYRDVRKVVRSDRNRVLRDELTRIRGNVARSVGIAAALGHGGIVDSLTGMQGELDSLLLELIPGAASDAAG